MNILIGLIQHESNTFNPVLTTIDDFDFISGKDIFDKFSSYRGTSLEGIIKFFNDKKVNMLPSVFALPQFEGGKVTLEAYRKIKEIFLEKVNDHRNNIDGICIALHGSMTVENI